MKKNILLIATLITLAANAQTHHVDADKAQRVASNFWLWHNTTPTRSDAWDIKTITFEGFDQLHIFDFNGTGFVIVPADDRVRQVLAYSFENPFPAELNPELRYWLRNYNNQIAAIAKSDAPCHKEWERPLVDPEPDSTVDLTGVPALLTTKWNQSSPFNKFCPYDSSAHARAVVGCVATAMAQVMKYWNYPAYGEGNHTYVPHAWHGGYQYDTLSVDFENSTYLWEYMPDDLSRTAFSYQRDAVATISYHCGVAVEMMYGTSSQGGSAAYSNCGPWANACATDAFRTYFKYDTSLYYGKRDSINNDSIWCALIDEQLALRQPMYYDGQDDEGGHAFVLDGSDTAGRYHFNMGWGGAADGFYTIDNLATDTGGIGSNATLTFNQDQGAIFDIKPAYEETFDTVDYYDTICPWPNWTPSSVISAPTIVTTAESSNGNESSSTPTSPTAPPRCPTSAPPQATPYPTALSKTKATCSLAGAAARPATTPSTSPANTSTSPAAPPSSPCGLTLPATRASKPSSARS